MALPAETLPSRSPERPVGAPVRDLRALRKVAKLTTPVTLAREHTLPVLDALTPLLPEGGLRRGSTLATEGPGATTLALALAARASTSGAWVAAVGLGDVGLTAAGELGAGLERWALVDEPGEQVSEVIAALVGAVDVLLIGPGIRLTASHGRRVSARMRERGTTLVQVRPPTRGSALSIDLTMRVDTGRWTGLGAGHGHLRCRRVEVVASGRGAAARPRRAALWLPGPDGSIAPVVAKRRTEGERSMVLSPVDRPDQLAVS